MNREIKTAMAIKSLMLLLLCLMSFNANANEMETRRIMVGIKLFPAVIAADTRLVEKKDKQGYLPIYILHDNKSKLAQDLARRLNQIKKIKNIPLKVEISTFDDFINGNTPAEASVFLAQPANDKMQKILDRAISSSNLLFSPFKGDIEKGVHSGFIVSDRILPYVNLNTMRQSRIKLKAFFLRVAKHYD